ncbi:hypothetical protein JXB41_07070 [Candidatus Woesearchaeota archaeon]|nr:hypothetical protein [Candidatus Woesearchaeota archaeon]
MAKKEDAKRILSNVPEDKAFYVCNGTTLKNLDETAKFLKKVDAATFQNHVNNEKNDFFAWINNTIGDIKLANQIKNLKTSGAISKKIQSRIRELKKQ